MKKKEDAKDFNSKLKDIKDKGLSFEDALIEADKLFEWYEKKYPSFIKYLKDKKESYFSFCKYPIEVRKFIYTTKKGRKYP